MNLESRVSRAARLSPQPGGQLPLPLLTHAEELRQGVTMYLSYSNITYSLTRAASETSIGHNVWASHPIHLALKST